MADNAIPNGPVTSTPEAARLAASGAAEEQQNALAAAGAEKLKAMFGGTLPPLPGAKRAEPTVAKPETTENQKAIAKLNAPDSDLWSKDEAKQKAAYNELRKHLAAEATADEKQAIADAPIGQLREQYGIETGPPAYLANQWDAEEEATILATFSQQGVAPEAVKAIHEWYSGVFTGALGRVGNIDVAAVESEFRALAKQHGVAQDVVDALVEDHRGRLKS